MLSFEGYYFSNRSAELPEHAFKVAMKEFKVGILK